MTIAERAALRWLKAGRPVILARVALAQGSAPREAGAAMAIAMEAEAGTIGGGNLERRVLEAARLMLLEDIGTSRLAFALGPSLGQCCGGRVEIDLVRLQPEDAATLEAGVDTAEAAWPRVVVFGAGHVARALALSLEPLPCRVIVVDEREDELARLRERHVERRLCPLAADAIDVVPPGGYALIMTYSHPLDLDLVEAGLKRGDLAWLGLIGSATKRARFSRQLKARGLALRQIERLVCPIGINGINGKEPAVIAASTAAQLLLAFEAKAAQLRLQAMA
ncbi:molybdenum cofactor sulfurylase [Arboricoccus pini]|uniref:Molybdenum cofactor sulfurylase n=1 Tax=Arboricoccus pini TaxID=1963835 RepID=A0A212QCA7_9PROT|nr:xanthine dehydrogenase accessory protein XdhC [Arboricoccus pini]SNB56953.1 molybdenum cofactor sulfurylase [Arboricoccus pini]